MPVGKLNAGFRCMVSHNCSKKECVLAVDDEAGFLGMLKAALECYDFTVHTASSSKEAIALYRDHQRDIRMVLLDYLLPEMSGELVFENLQGLNPDVRVVLLTVANNRWPIKCRRQACGATSKNRSACQSLFKAFGTPSMPVPHAPYRHQLPDPTVWPVSRYPTVSGLTESTKGRRLFWQCSNGHAPPSASPAEVISLGA